MKSRIIILLTLACTLTLSSCTVIKEKAYPFIDNTAVRADYERVQAYKLLEKDSIVVVPGMDTAIDTTPQGVKRKNIQLHSIVEKPKVAFQEKHKDWLNSASGYKCSLALFYAMVATSVLGFILPFLVVWIRSKRGKCSSAFNHFHPFVLCLLTILEAVYLFMFNYTFAVLSPTIYGFWRWVLNMVCMVAIIITQTMTAALYAEHLAMENDSGSNWWSRHVKICWILGIAGMLFYKYISFFLQTIALLFSIIAFLFTLFKNKKVKGIPVKVYTITLLFFPWVFVYFLSYTLLLILVVLLCCVGLIFVFKGLGMGAEFGADQAAITQRFERNPERYVNREQAEREYYNEKKDKARRKAKRG